MQLRIEVPDEFVDEFNEAMDSLDETLAWLAEDSDATTCREDYLTRQLWHALWVAERETARFEIDPHRLAEETDKDD